MSLNAFKETVSAAHFCDIQRNNLEVDIAHDFPTITIDEYRQWFLLYITLITFKCILFVVVMT